MKPSAAPLTFRIALALAVTWAGAVALSACSQVPVAGTYPVAYQHKMQSVAHWHGLAKEVTARVAEQVAADPALQGKPLYIRKQSGQSSFNDGFHSLLLTEMLNAGLPITLEAGDAHEVVYKTQVVEHADRPLNRPAPGAITGLTAALLAPEIIARDDNLSYWEAGTVGIGEAAALDLGLGAMTRETETELVFTVSVWDDGILRFREQEIFYILPKDAVLYAGAPAKEPSRMEIAF